MSRDTRKISTHLARIVIAALLGLVVSGVRFDVSASCPIVVPANPIVVAPNQPEVPADSITGIVNALCDVKLDFVACSFSPTAISINCDSSGDGVPDLIIPLTNITQVNGLLG